MPNKHYIIPNWPAPENIAAVVTTRSNGYSKPPFSSFNLGKNTGDEPDTVAANCKKLREELQLMHEPLWLNQVHGTQVACADFPTQQIVTADATYATQANRVCVIATADCLPVLLCDRNGTKVAAIHAGWRGLCAGIIEATIKTMQIPGNEILAWLGPAIGPQKFEVGEEVRQQFLAVDSNANIAFIPSSQNNKWFANLYTLAKQRLAQCQVNQVYGGDYCTFTDADRFFSYRRDAGKTGRGILVNSG